MSAVRVGRLYKASDGIVRSGDVLRRLVLQFIPRTGDSRGVTAQGHTANARSLTSNQLKRPPDWEPLAQSRCSGGCTGESTHPSPTGSPRDKTMENGGGKPVSRRGKTPTRAGGDHVSEGGATVCCLPPPRARSRLVLGRWTDG